MMDILAELLAHIQSDAEMRGPPGPAGPRGEQGPPGKLPMVKLWVPETVFMRATSSPMTAARFRRGATPGSRRRMPTGSASPLPAATARASPCAARSTRAQTIIGSTSSPSTAAASSRSRMRLVPARVLTGSCWRAPASAAPPARRESAALPVRGAMRERAARPFGTGRSIVRATSRRPS